VLPDRSALPCPCRNYRDQGGELDLGGVATDDAKHRPPPLIVHACPPRSDVPPPLYDPGLAIM